MRPPSAGWKNLSCWDSGLSNVSVFVFLSPGKFPALDPRPVTSRAVLSRRARRLAGGNPITARGLVDVGVCLWPYVPNFVFASFLYVRR